jgi:hypothetical protein
MSSRIRVMLTIGLAALFAFALIAAPASADVSSFADQGRAAGLTAEQIKTLQAKADDYLAKMGGTQVSLNRIDLNGKATLNITLPGEDHPRVLAAPYGAQFIDAACPFLDFCAYSGSNFTGDQINMFTCGKYFMPFGSGGSWDNNQTTGTRACFYRDIDARSLIHCTAPAHSSNLNANWLPVVTVVNC